MRSVSDFGNAIQTTVESPHSFLKMHVTMQNAPRSSKVVNMAVYRISECVIVLMAGTEQRAASKRKTRNATLDVTTQPGSDPGTLPTN